MELSTRPEGKPVRRRPGVFVGAVVLDGLEETPEEIEVHGEDVVEAHKGAKHGAKAQDKGFHRMGVFGGHADGRLVFVVNFVNVLIPDTPMQ